VTNKLKDMLNMDDGDDEINDVEEVDSIPMELPPEKTKEEIMTEAGQIMNSLSNSEKVDSALSLVNGLDSHDADMDDIAVKALSSYKDLCDLGFNISDQHAGKIYEVAAQMLKTALDARDAKVSKKLKMIELQIKKMRVDKYADESGKDTGNGGSGSEFDRNELLKHFADIAKQDDSDNSDK